MGTTCALSMAAARSAPGLQASTNPVAAAANAAAPPRHSRSSQCSKQTLKNCHITPDRAQQRSDPLTPWPYTLTNPAAAAAAAPVFRFFFLPERPPRKPSLSGPA